MPPTDRKPRHCRLGAAFLGADAMPAAAEPRDAARPCEQFRLRLFASAPIPDAGLRLAISPWSPIGPRETLVTHRSCSRCALDRRGPRRGHWHGACDIAPNANIM